MAGNFVPKVRANDPPLLQGERWRPAGRVTHLAGHLFNRGGAFQAPCPFSLLVKWQDKIETPRRGARRGLRGEKLACLLGEHYFPDKLDEGDLHAHWGMHCTSPSIPTCVGRPQDASPRVASIARGNTMSSLENPAPDEGSAFHPYAAGLVWNHERFNSCEYEAGEILSNS